MTYDSLLIAQPSLDVNTDHEGHTVREIGGAVVYSAYAASALGHAVAVLPRCDPAQIDVQAVFAQAENVTVLPIAGSSSTSIANTYHTADKERRTCAVISRIAPYTAADLPDADAKIIHIAGLMRGDVEEGVIEAAAKRAAVAVDVQGFLRCARPNGSMEFEDWPRKKELLPLIRYLKTDAAEAEIMTGTADRRAAAAQLVAWGAGEVMITHNSEVLIFDGKDYCAQPLRPRNLSGRTGRGDTCFSSYITERLTQSIPAALRTAAAVVSLKMEQTGPFRASREELAVYMEAFYPV